MTKGTVEEYFKERAQRDPGFAAASVIEKKKLDWARTLRELRINRGISQGDLAKLLKVKKSKITKAEQGRGLKLGLILRIVQALEVTWQSTLTTRSGTVSNILLKPD